jgi:alanine racemase
VCSHVRSEITIDLGALRRNVERLRRVIGETELWAVVKADGYGHGAADVAGAAVDAGARALCVATVAEGLSLRRVLPGPRILVLGPSDQIREAREGRLELVVAGGAIPEDVPVHVKLDTGMGRYGFERLPPLTANVVGLMTHLATADTDPAFAERQLERFRELAAGSDPGLTLHAANSAAALRLPSSRLDAARCGIAIYGLSPFGTDPGDDGLEPVLRWKSELAQVKKLETGESTGYGRTFVADRPTWIGIVPVGYADGFRRDLAGTDVLVGGERRCVVGTISMDSLAVELDGPVEPGTPVTLIGDGLLAEEHARRAGTITYELVSGIRTSPERAARVVVGG